MRLIDPQSLLDERPVRAWMRRRNLLWVGGTLACVALLGSLHEALVVYPFLGWYGAAAATVAIGNTRANRWIYEGHWPPTQESRRSLLRLQVRWYGIVLMVGGSLSTLGLLQARANLGVYRGAAN